MKILNKLKNLNILYLEDNEIVRKNISETISLFVKKTYAVSCVEDALEVYEEERIDIIITDIDMPEINGLEFVELIRKENATIPIVVITAYKTEEFLFRAISLHLETYIVKPVSYAQLKTILISCTQKLEKLNKLEIIFSSGSSYNISSQLLRDKNKEPIKLQNKERLLLNLLLEQQNHITYYSEIEQNVWEEDELNKDSLKVLIGKLRKKTGHNMILNESELGYRLIL